MKLWKIIVLALSASVCMAEEIQQGKVYPGGTYVESSQTGVGLTIPQGWQGAWPRGSEMFVLESADLKSNIFMAFEQGDEAGLKAMMSNAIPLDASVQLVPVSSPKKTGAVYTANYTVMGAPQLSGYIAAQILSPSMGVAFIALSADASKMPQVEKITLKLANSLTVKSPVPSVANTSLANSDGDLWNNYFKGRYIARYYSGSNYREVQHLWLCSDGRFLRKFESGSSSLSGASGASSSRGEGYWTATGATGGEGQLILQFGTGSLSEISTPGGDYATSGAGGERWVYRVSLGKELYLDGKKWFPAGKNKVCG